MKYEEWLKEWLNVCVKFTVKSRTFQKYSSIVERHLIPDLGKIELEKLTTVILQEYVSRLSEKFAPNTVWGIVTIIKCSLKTAEKMEIVKKQHSDCIMRPKMKEKEVACFNREEQRRIENYIKINGSPKLYGIIICLYTGIRIGELMALTWEDVYFDQNYIIIKKSCHDSWDENGYHKIIEEPKTKSSTRIIPIAMQLKPYLMKLYNSGKSDYVISQKELDISVRSYQRTFELLLKKLGIQHKGFHALRHTFATRAIECGMDIKTLSEILGHNNYNLTLRRYAHSLIEHKSNMMNLVGEMLLA